MDVMQSAEDAPRDDIPASATGPERTPRRDQVGRPLDAARIREGRPNSPASATVTLAPSAILVRAVQH